MISLIKGRLAAALGGVALVALVGVAGYAYTQHTRLTAAQGRIEALGAEKDRLEGKVLNLQRENDALYRLNARLDAMRADAAEIQKEIQRVPKRALSAEEEAVARRIFQ